jgi:hypothetical protein
MDKKRINEKKIPHKNFSASEAGRRKYKEDRPLSDHWQNDTNTTAHPPIQKTK